MLFAAMSLAAVLGDLGMIPVAAEESYMLRNCGGYIAVYSAMDDKTPRMYTDIRVDALPLGDRLELAHGVAAADYGTVLRMLEDYGA